MDFEASEARETAVAAKAVQPRRLTLLGATGSIGDSCFDVLMANPDGFAVETLAAHTNAEKLAQRAVALSARRAVVAEEGAYGALKAALAGTGIEAAAGPAALMDAAREPVDLMVCSMVGAAGIGPAMAALEAGSHLALANKEALVCAGPVMTALAQRQKRRIMPLDSEHNALFQVFEQTNRAEIDKVTLTASGGPFRTWSAARIREARRADALNHPNWSMGQKVTIDSATLANKGLEVIEAHHLFALSADAIDVVVHPQSIIHGMVHYSDGSVLAQLGDPDMRTPIAAALAWPGRWPVRAVKRLDLASLGQLTFEPPDRERFPLLQAAFDALRGHPAMPAVFNAANEVAVEAFLADACAFHHIAAIVCETMASMDSAGLPEFIDLDDVLETDAEARHIARSVLEATAA
jgi:1-deoxy-D-xylulose-5-phosphate reductoisomerase